MHWARIRNWKLGIEEKHGCEVVELEKPSFQVDITLPMSIMGWSRANIFNPLPENDVHVFESVFHKSAMNIQISMDIYGKL